MASKLNLRAETIISLSRQATEVSLEFCEDVGVDEIWEELLTTSKLLCSTYLKIKGISSLKALALEVYWGVQ